jgi:hypothetical protein
MASLATSPELKYRALPVNLCISGTVAAGLVIAVLGGQISAENGVVEIFFHFFLDKGNLLCLYG